MGKRANEEIFWGNILCLGFDPEGEEKRHGIKFNCSMFDGKNNQKGMEVVLNFLVRRNDPTSSRTIFRGIWPIKDRKQASEFKKVVAGIIGTRLFALQNAGGERFLHLLSSFSSKVLLNVLKRESPLTQIPLFCSPDFQPDFSGDILKDHIRACKMRIVVEARTLALLIDSMIHSHDRWKAILNDINKHSIEASRELSSLNGLNVEETQIDENDVQRLSEDLLQRWSPISEYLEMLQTEKEVIDCALHRKERHRLDFEDLIFNPPVLNHPTPPLLEKGKLDLSSLVKIGIACINELADPLCEVHTFGGPVQEHLSSLANAHRQHLLGVKERCQAISVQINNTQHHLDMLSPDRMPPLPKASSLLPHTPPTFSKTIDLLAGAEKMAHSVRRISKQSSYFGQFQSYK